MPWAVGSWHRDYTRQAELARRRSVRSYGEPEIAEVALIRYVIAAMDLVDLHEVGDAGQERTTPPIGGQRATRPHSARSDLSLLFLDIEVGSRPAQVERTQLLDEQLGDGPFRYHLAI